MAVTVVGRMVFTPCLFPSFAVVGEERVCLGWCVVHLCQAETVGLAEQVSVEACSADDVYLFVGLAGEEELVPGAEALAARQRLLAAGEHAVAAVGQCPLGQAFKGAAPHQDGVAGGELLEALQVVGQPVDELVLIADGAVAGHGGNHGYHGRLTD